MPKMSVLAWLPIALIAFVLASHSAVSLPLTNDATTAITPKTVGSESFQTSSDFSLGKKSTADVAGTTTGTEYVTPPSDSFQLLALDEQHAMVRDNSDSLHNRSFCRWTYGINHNDSRMPADIQVVTSCSKLPNDQTENQCDIVYFWTPVLVKQQTAEAASIEGHVTWMNSWERLPVGCAIANPVKLTPLPTPPQTMPPFIF